jgi:formate dehydrogenase subunit gamma
MTPAQPTLSAAEMQDIIDHHLHLEGPLLPILHAVQQACGHIPQDARPMIADALNISRAELHGVISFYHDFRDTPGGRHVLKICRAEACQAMGGAALANATLAKLGVDWHGTTSDGAITVEPVYCLGLCACAPAILLDDRVLGRVDTPKLDAMLAQVTG